MASDPPTVVVVGAGQSGLAGARAAQEAGLRPIVLEASGRPSGSWSNYYDSLTLFSPARYSSMPGYPFPGDPDRYPTKHEVADYLASYADHLGVDLRINTRVEAVEPVGHGFVVHTPDETLPAGDCRRERDIRPPAPAAGRRSGILYRQMPSRR